jgi:hypothetical protein
MAPSRPFEGLRSPLYNRLRGHSRRNVMAIKGVRNYVLAELSHAFAPSLPPLMPVDLNVPRVVFRRIYVRSMLDRDAIRVNA